MVFSNPSLGFYWVFNNACFVLSSSVVSPSGDWLGREDGMELMIKETRRKKQEEKSRRKKREEKNEKKKRRRDGADDKRNNCLLLASSPLLTPVLHSTLVLHKGCVAGPQEKNWKKKQYAWRQEISLTTISQTHLVFLPHCSPVRCEAATSCRLFAQQTLCRDTKNTRKGKLRKLRKSKLKTHRNYNCRGTQITKTLYGVLTVSIWHTEM